MNVAYLPQDSLKAWRKSFKKKRAYPESAIATGLIKWFSFAHKVMGVPSDHLLIHLKNESKQSAIAGARMKLQGVRAGASDYILLVPRGQYHGLCLELKAPGGKLSAHQVAWLNLVDKQGYLAKVAFSLNDAMQIITDYLKL